MATVCLYKRPSDTKSAQMVASWVVAQKVPASCAFAAIQVEAVMMLEISGYPSLTKARGARLRGVAASCCGVLLLALCG